LLVTHQTNMFYVYILIVNIVIVTLHDTSYTYYYYIVT
jgi:hypothetical protein